MTEIINFYSQRGAYGCFSNYFNYGVNIEDTNEHYFQAKKYEGTKFEEKIRLCKSPTIAKKFGNRGGLPGVILRSDWEEVKDMVMYTCVKAKFDQSEECRRILMGTGLKSIIEHTKWDKYWGDGGDGSGKNHLGKILMFVRKNYR